MKKYRLEIKIIGIQVFSISAENENKAIENIKQNPERYIIIDNIENDWENVKIEEE